MHSYFLDNSNTALSFTRQASPDDIICLSSDEEETTTEYVATTNAAENKINVINKTRFVPSTNVEVIDLVTTPPVDCIPTRPIVNEPLINVASSNQTRLENSPKSAFPRLNQAKTIYYLPVNAVQPLIDASPIQVTSEKSNESLIFTLTEPQRFNISSVRGTSSNFKVDQPHIRINKKSEIVSIFPREEIVKYLPTDANCEPIQHSKVIPKELLASEIQILPAPENSEIVCDEPFIVEGKEVTASNKRKLLLEYSETSASKKIKSTAIDIEISDMYGCNSNERGGYGQNQNRGRGNYRRFCDGQQRCQQTNPNQQFDRLSSNSQFQRFGQTNDQQLPFGNQCGVQNLRDGQQICQRFERRCDNKNFSQFNINPGTWRQHQNVPFDMNSCISGVLPFSTGQNCDNLIRGCSNQGFQSDPTCKQFSSSRGHFQQNFQAFTQKSQQLPIRGNRGDQASKFSPPSKFRNENKQNSSSWRLQDLNSGVYQIGEKGAHSDGLTSSTFPRGKDMQSTVNIQGANNHKSQNSNSGRGKGDFSRLKKMEAPPWLREAENLKANAPDVESKKQDDDHVPPHFSKIQSNNNQKLSTPPLSRADSACSVGKIDKCKSTVPSGRLEGDKTVDDSRKDSCQASVQDCKKEAPKTTIGPGPKRYKSKEAHSSANAVVHRRGVFRHYKSRQYAHRNLTFVNPRFLDRSSCKALPHKSISKGKHEATSKQCNNSPKSYDNQRSTSITAQERQSQPDFRKSVDADQCSSGKKDPLTKSSLDTKESDVESSKQKSKDPEDVANRELGKIFYKLKEI